MKVYDKFIHTNKTDISQNARFKTHIAFLRRFTLVSKFIQDFRDGNRRK